MLTDGSVGNQPAWTWADLFSTYRFWGLVLWSVLTSTAMQFHFLTITRHLADGLGFPVRFIGAVMMGRFAAIPFAFFLAWLIIRTKPVRGMVITGVTMVVAALVIASSGPQGVVAVVAASYFLYTGSLIALIVFPALIAGTRSGSYTFFVAFGLAFSLASLLGQGGSAALSFILPATGPGGMAFWTAGLLVVALVFLIPVKRVLFTVGPPPRGRAIPHKFRDPLVTAVLAGFVPFYILYWLYQIHGEAANLRPSRRLLSPRGAVGVSFAPFMAPVILVTLTDHLNEHAASLDLPPVRRTWVIALWCFLLGPVAVGLLQDSMNRLAGPVGRPETIPA